MTAITDRMSRAQYGPAMPSKPRASNAPQPQAVVTLVIDDAICKAECSICGEPLPMRKAGPSTEEQGAMLRAVFEDHLRRRHRSVAEFSSKPNTDRTPDIV